MIRTRDLILRCFFVGLTLQASAQQFAPAAPAPPPQVGTLAGHPDWPAAKNSNDVDTVDHLVSSLYDVISGPAGNRDWQRFRSLFVPDGRIGSIHPDSPTSKGTPARGSDVLFLTPDMFAQNKDPTFKTKGFFEHSIANRFEEFGSLVEVWSTYEIKDAQDDAQPFSLGINSFQIVRAHGRFWIVSLLLDNERSGVTLPANHLSTEDHDESVKQPW